MNKQLKDYVRVYKSQIPKMLCDQLISEIDLVEWMLHRFYSNDGLVDNGTEPYEYHGITAANQELRKIFWNSLEQYILKDIKLDCFAGWNGFSNFKYVRYTAGTEMKNHCDHIHSLFGQGPSGIPILSMIGQLNSDFTGGEFVMFDDTVIPLSKGDIIIFPSIFLYPHRITPVMSGVRYSIVSWSY